MGDDFFGESIDNRCECCCRWSLRRNNCFCCWHTFSMIPKHVDFVWPQWSNRLSQLLLTSNWLSLWTERISMLLIPMPLRRCDTAVNLIVVQKMHIVSASWFIQFWSNSTNSAMFRLLIFFRLSGWPLLLLDLVMLFSHSIFQHLLQSLQIFAETNLCEFGIDFIDLVHIVRCHFMNAIVIITECQSTVHHFPWQDNWHLHASVVDGRLDFT